MLIFFRCLISFCCCLFVNSLTAQNLKLEFIGKAFFETGLIFNEVELGGLSGITYEKSSDTFFCISDDYSKRAPARFYKLKIDLSDGNLQDGDIVFKDVIFLKNAAGAKFRLRTIDAEGIASRNGHFFISSEGKVRHQIPPFVAKFSAEGDFVENINLPKKFLSGENRGIQNNLGFESLCLTPDGSFLFTANEKPLVQDDINSDAERRAPVRILQFDLQKNSATKEFLYWVEPVNETPLDQDDFRINGLVEMIALSGTRLLTLERSYTKGVGISAKIYEIDLTNAGDLSALAQLKDEDISKIKAVEKTLLFDLNTLPEKLDNFEGMTFGPALPDGKQFLIIVSDNNFNAAQTTIFFAFSVSGNIEQTQTTIAQIQGSGHTSPYLNKEVTGVRGILTAISKSSGSPGFWLQSPEDDGNMATSQGIFVAKKENEIALNIGDLVQVDGMVAEQGRRNELTLTQIKAKHIEIISSGNDLPEPVMIGENGRRQPDTIVDDDSLQSFDPETDGIDFYESLEGMRVVLQNPLVVGPMNRFNEMVVVPDHGKNASGLSLRGGIVLGADDSNPERLFLIPPKDKPFDPKVGDHFAGAVSGILLYSFGNFKVLVDQPLPELVSSETQRETTSLKADENYLTIASYNVYNLNGQDRDKKFSRIARSIVENLNSPDILALQEVQDNDGADKSGVVDASLTLTRLIANIESAGGPKYDFCQIDPVYNKEGGQPGGNIRVAFLYNPSRVQLEKRGQATATDSTLLITDAKGLHFSPNPGRLSPQNKAFNRSRVPLATEFKFNGHKLFIINNHLRSKGGDDAIFGSVQPPVYHSEGQRSSQAAVISKFVKTILQQDENANVIVLGDMNDYEFRKPMQILKETPLINLGETVPRKERYTYVYQGNSLVLDHIFVSKNLITGDAKVDIVHINAEYPTAQRASDHDPIVARFKLPVDVVKK